MKYRVEIAKYFNNLYYANVTVDDGDNVKSYSEELPDTVDYRTLRKGIKNVTGIDLPRCKELKFEGGEYKKYAYVVDGTPCHPRYLRDKNIIQYYDYNNNTFMEIPVSA